MSNFSRSKVLKSSLAAAAAALLSACGGAFPPGSPESRPATQVPSESTTLQPGQMYRPTIIHRSPSASGKLRVNGILASTIGQQRFLGPVQLEFPDSVVSGSVDSLELVGGRLVAQGGHLYIRHGVFGMSTITVAGAKK